jgi:Resolvase, N terminal domain
MIYGYARVSTDGQSLDAQVKQLRAAGAEKAFVRPRAARRPTAFNYAASSASLCRGRSDRLPDALRVWSLHSFSPLGLVVRGPAMWIITAIAFAHSWGHHRPTEHSGFDPSRRWPAFATDRLVVLAVVPMEPNPTKLVTEVLLLFRRFLSRAGRQR